MKKTFSELLVELGEELELSLEPDTKNACTILIDEKIPIQLEEDPFGENILIAATVMAIPPGKFREKILLTALKANSLYPRPGIFGYAENSNELILFDSLALGNLTGKMMSDKLLLISTTAQQWAKALEHGDLTTLLPKE